MTEPDVTLTDWGLAILAGLCAWRLARSGRLAAPRGWFVLFFGSVAAAALLGGVVHGFFLDPRSWGARFLWPGTLLAVGLSALAAWAGGAALAFPSRVARGVTAAAAVAFVVYAALVVLVTPSFALAIAGYGPAALFLLAAFLLTYRRTGDARVLTAVGGLVMILAGSAVQWRGIALHPAYFNHNALYHIIEAVGLMLLFRGARRLDAFPVAR